MTNAFSPVRQLRVHGSWRHVCIESRHPPGPPPRRRPRAHPSAPADQTTAAPAIATLADEQIRRSAQDLGYLIRSEDGIAEAISILEGVR